MERKLVANRKGRSRNAGLLLALLLSAGMGIAGSCGGNSIPGPRDGLRDYEGPAIVALPLGALNTMGGNWSLRRVDFSIDTRIGTREVGATWNAVSAGWQWSFEPTFDGQTFVSPGGARLEASVPDGSAIPGTHWVRIDANRVATKGGIVHAFDPGDGRLVALHWASNDWPRLRFVSSPIAGSERLTLVEQCTDAATCQPVYTIERDASGEVIRLVDRAGRIAEMDRDATGRLVAARDPKDVAEGWPGQQYEYAGPRLSAIVNSEGERVELSFANRRLASLKQVGAGDPTWSIVYLLKSAEGPPALWTTEVTDPLGHTTRYRFDSQRRLHERENPLGELESWVWTGVRPIEATDAAGLVTTRIWVGDDLATETGPSGNTLAYTYAGGSVDRNRPDQTPIASIVDDLGTLVTRSYDGSGRLVDETDAEGGSTTYGWGADESLVRVTEPSGRETLYSGHGEHGHPSAMSRGQYVYSVTLDAVGNLVHGGDPGPQDGGVVARQWDGDRNVVGLVLEDQPASGTPTQALLTVERRSDGRVVRVDRPLGGDTTLLYDALGREVSRAEWVSPGGAAAATPRYTVRAYDAAGRLVAEDRPNGMRRELAYDAAGRVQRETHRRSGVVESDVAWSFIAARPVLAEDPARGFAESTSYDAAGRAAHVVHSDGEATRTFYDVRSRPTLRELESASGTLIQAVAFGYDGAGRLESIGDGTSELIHWVRTAGAVSSVSRNSGLAESVGVVLGLAASRTLSRGGSDLAYAYFVHQDSRLVLETLYVTESSAAGYASQGFEVSAPGDPERRIAYSQDAGFDYSRYFFDHASNLTRSRTPERGAIDWSYNAEGNRLLSGASGGTQIASWSWDEAGFATERGGVAFAWTARGAISVVHEIATGSELVRIDYDALGRRKARTVNGLTVGWSHGGALERDAIGNPVAADLGVVRIAIDGQHVYRHTDSRGNVVMRSHQDGTIQTLKSYDAYGPLETVGEMGDLEHGFGLGLELPIDAALGPVYVMGERVYDPLIGRFLSPDPVPHLINDYAYTLGNPVEFWDPTGRDGEAIDWAVVGTWAVAIGSTVIVGGACVSAVGTGGAGAAICLGSIVVAAGAWAQVAALPMPDVAGFSPEVPNLARNDPSLFVCRCTVTVHEPGEFFRLGSGGGSFRPFLER